MLTLVYLIDPVPLTYRPPRLEIDHGSRPYRAHLNITILHNQDMQQSQRRPAFHLSLYCSVVTCRVLSVLCRSSLTKPPWRGVWSYIDTLWSRGICALVRPAPFRLFPTMYRSMLSWPLLSWWRMSAALSIRSHLTLDVKIAIQLNRQREQY